MTSCFIYSRTPLPRPRHHRNSGLLGNANLGRKNSYKLGNFRGVHYVTRKPRKGQGNSEKFRGPCNKSDRARAPHARKNIRGAGTFHVPRKSSEDHITSPTGHAPRMLGKISEGLENFMFLGKSGACSEEFPREGGGGADLTHATRRNASGSEAPQADPAPHSWITCSRAVVVFAWCVAVVLFVALYAPFPLIFAGTYVQVLICIWRSVLLNMYFDQEFSSVFYAKVNVLQL